MQPFSFAMKKIFYCIASFKIYNSIFVSNIYIGLRKRKKKEKRIHNIFLLLWGIFIFWYAPRLYIYLFIGEGEMKFRKGKRSIGEKYK